MKSKKKVNKKMAAGAGAFLIAVGIFGSSLYASAWGGDPNAKAPWYSAERHEAIQNAIKNKDYNAWKNLKTEQMNARLNWLFSKVTSDNFSKFSEMHKLINEGKYDEANKIRAELGLPLKYGKIGMHRAFN